MTGVTKNQNPRVISPCREDDIRRILFSDAREPDDRYDDSRELHITWTPLLFRAYRWHTEVIRIRLP